MNDYPIFEIRKSLQLSSDYIQSPIFYYIRFPSSWFMTLGTGDLFYCFPWSEIFYKRLSPFQIYKFVSKYLFVGEFIGEEDITSSYDVQLQEFQIDPGKLKLSPETIGLFLWRRDLYMEYRKVIIRNLVGEKDREI